MDALDRNWARDRIPPPDQLRLYADVARQSIRSRGVSPDDVSDIQVRRLEAVSRALRELGEAP